MTGKLGGLVLDLLLKTLPPSSIGVSVRDPSKATHLAQQGIRVRQGSYDDPTSLAESFAGADTILLVSSNDRSGKGESHHRTVIDAAKSAGVRCIYYTSHQAASPTCAFWPMRVHYATEGMLAESGMEYVSLRNGFYMDSINMFIRGVQHTGVISVPKDGKVSWTAHEDLAMATAELMLRPRIEQGRREIITLAAGEALDMADVAKAYGEAKGKEIKREMKEAEEWKTGAVAGGVPEGMADMLLGFYEASRQGDFLSEDGTLGELIEGKTISVKEMFEKH